MPNYCKRITNANLVTLDSKKDYGIIENATLVFENGIIKWIGKEAYLPEQYNQIEQIDAEDQYLTPSLIDCHTHCVYAGDRASEFEQRLNGISYEQIALNGGGIRSTVSATRKASEQQLLDESMPRVQHLINEGIGVIEIKSGYGLELETELKMLRVARRLGELLPIEVKTTFLGAHALPPEYNNKQDYIDTVCQQMIPRVAELGLADYVDVFCETIGFNLAQTEQVFKSAVKHHLPIKIHAEQLNLLGGAELAANYRALSADHLEYLDQAGATTMAAHKTVATLLPGAYYFLREERKPPVALLREHGVDMAIATDCNPGSSPTTSLLLMMNMACTLFRFTPLEALKAVTLHAAQALGLSKDYGTLSVGKKANFVLWDINNPAELSYRLANNPRIQRYHQGEPV